MRVKNATAVVGSGLPFVEWRPGRFPLIRTEGGRKGGDRALTGRRRYHTWFSQPASLILTTWVRYSKTTSDSPKGDLLRHLGQSDRQDSMWGYD